MLKNQCLVIILKSKNGNGDCYRHKTLKFNVKKETNFKVGTKCPISIKSTQEKNQYKKRKIQFFFRKKMFGKNTFNFVFKISFIKAPNPVEVMRKRSDLQSNILTLVIALFVLNWDLNNIFRTIYKIFLLKGRKYLFYKQVHLFIIKYKL